MLLKANFMKRRYFVSKMVLFPAEAGMVPLVRTPIPASAAHPAIFSLEDLPGIRRPKREVDHSSLSSGNIMKAWISVSTYACVFLACRLGTKTTLHLF
jgi:hypothetical protein